MKYNKLATSLFFSGMLLLSGCGSSDSKDSTPPAAETPASSETPASTEVVASTTITTTRGQTIKVNRTANGFIFEGYEGKIVLLEVYGDTCPHCVAAIPAYNRLHAKYPNDVVIIALESYGTLTNAGLQQYITVPKTNTGSMFAFIKELTGYNLEAVPYLMILARDGSISYNNILATFPETEIETRIQQLQ